MVANTLQCALQLSLNELRCVESQGGHPDRGRTSAEKPEWEKAGVHDVLWGRSEEEGSRRIGRREVGTGTSSGRIWKTMARNLDFI